MLFIGVLEVLSWNLGQATRYPHFGFPQSHWQVPGWYQDYITTTSFQISSNSSFAYHPTMRRYEFYTMKGSLRLSASRYIIRRPVEREWKGL
jgi:hypothetical protein